MPRVIFCFAPPQVAETLKVKGLVEENRSSDPSGPHIKEEEPHHPHMQHSPPTISTSSPSNLQTAHSSSNNNSPPHSTNGSQYKNPYSVYGKSPNSERRMNLPMWAVPGLPIHPSSVQQHNQPHPAATAAAAMLSSCYEAVSSDLSPLKKKKLSSILINRDTPILRTVLGQGQADSSQPVSLVCHPDSHDSRGSESSDQHRMEKVSL